MSDTEPGSDRTFGSARRSDDGRRFALAVYILFLVNIVLALVGIVGLVIAYLNQGSAPDWLKTHYRFQIRTFWIGLLYAVISGILIPFVIGYFLAIGVLIWLVVRCVKGINHLSQGEAYPNPTSWLLG